MFTSISHENHQTLLAQAFHLVRCIDGNMTMASAPAHAGRSSR
jgi:hypothetical protein